MINIRYLSYGLILLWAFSPLLKADEPSNADVAQPSPINKTNSAKFANGSATSAWLELQRSGSQASPYKQSVSGPVMENIYERYKASFSHPIPDAKEQSARRTK